MASLSAMISNDAFWSDAFNEVSKDGSTTLSLKYDIKEFTEFVSYSYNICLSKFL